MSKLTEEAAEFIRTQQRNAARTLPERVLEEVLGRQLQDYETALFKDGNPGNFKPSNLIVGLKAGVDFRLLTCRHCGARQMGITAIEEPSEHPVGSEDG